MKILIADDLEAKVLMLQTCIEQNDFPATVLVAKTTDEAKMLIDENPDIAFGLIDYEIPSENGPAIIKYLKEKNPDVRAALCTAYSKDEYEKEAITAGAEAFVCTSEDMEEVEKEMRELLEEWKMRK